MNYNQDFEINKIAFNNNGLNSIQSQYFVSENWPVVYILNKEEINMQCRSAANLGFGLDYVWSNKI